MVFRVVVTDEDCLLHVVSVGILSPHGFDYFEDSFAAFDKCGASTTKVILHIDYNER